MTSESPAFFAAPPPGRGTEVWLEDLVGGPWATTVTGHAGELLRIEAPRLGHQRVVLPENETFTITYRDGEVPCEAPAEIVAAPADAIAGGDIFVRLAAPPVRLQRRGTVRVPIQVIVRASARGRDDLAAGDVLAGVTENLSGDGALVRLERRLDIGEHVDVSVQCGGSAGTVHAVGVVVRCEGGGSRSRPWRAALAFREFPPSEQDRLVRHLFERQRELRRREMEAI